MKLPDIRRHSPARIATILALLVVFGSTAWAEVLPLGNSAKSPQLTFVQAASLASLNSETSRESQRLRIRLIKEKREDRREARQKRRERLEKQRAEDSAVSTTTSTYSPSGSSYSGQANWDAIAQCESGGRWDLNTGNGYWGGLQFAPNTWFAYGGGSFDGEGPFPYSREQQIAVAERVLGAQGPSAWPNCFVWA